LVEKERPLLINELNISLVMLAGVTAAATWRDAAHVVVATTGMAVLIIGYTYRWWTDGWEQSRPYRTQFVAWLRSRFAKAEEEALSIDIYEAFFGFIETTGKPVFQSLAKTGHIFITGMSRYGKTVLIYNVLYYLLVGNNHEPHELMIAFADAKRTSYQIFARIPHLFVPIATNRKETAVLLRKIKAELDARIKKFEIYAGRYICTNIDEYATLSGERLPRLLVFLDETADLIQKGSQAEKDLESLAKMGLAYGITLVMATQRPTAPGMSHEAQSQCDTFFSSYMKNNTEYGAVAKIPKAVYSRMTPAKGRFMAYIPDMAPVFWDEFPDCEGWGFVRTRLIPNKEIEALARELSDGRQRKAWEQSDLEPVTEEMTEKWGGSEENKLRLIHQLHESLGHMPTAVELRGRHRMSRKTSEDWMRRYRERYG